jgi:hypothetical protein
MEDKTSVTPISTPSSEAATFDIGSIQVICQSLLFVSSVSLNHCGGGGSICGADGILNFSNLILCTVCSVYASSAAANAKCFII